MQQSFPFPEIYLASVSPRRHELLQQIGLPHSVLHLPISADIDEPQLPGEHPSDYVQRTAREKATRARAFIKQQALPTKPILTADTSVMLDDLLVDKAHTDEDVRDSLHILSGKTHEVHTHIVLCHAEQWHETTSITQVKMRPLTEADINLYVQNGEGIGKAGGYAIQGLGSVLVESINGSYSGVMGLPLMELWLLLRKFAVSK